MRQEIEASGKTVEDAVAAGAAKLGVDVSMITFEVIKAPKKGFLGFGEAPAKVLVYYEAGSEVIALNFVRQLIADMGIHATAELHDLPQKGAKLIDIEGEDAGILIGHHGETLDSLQYLVNLAANRREEDEESRGYVKITVDVENYRAKREETLRQLARRMASKVLKYKKSITLEPMNPYERRIIHSEIQNIEGVSTNSIGSDNNRRIVVFLVDKNGNPIPSEKTARTTADKNDNQKKSGRNSRSSGRNRRPKSSVNSTEIRSQVIFEQIDPDELDLGDSDDLTDLLLDGEEDSYEKELGEILSSSAEADISE